MSLDRSIPNEFWPLIQEGTKNVLRIGQLIDNFHCWLKQKDINPFYLENKEYCQHLQEFINGQIIV